MDRYGAPRFRGASTQGYPVRQPTSRSGILGPVPTAPHRPPQSILKNSRQSEWQGSRPSNTGRDGILGAPPKQPSRDSYGSRPPNWDDRQMKSGDSRKSDEVSQLMKSLGLSQADIQKLSQMPEHEINVNNLARAIGDLKKGQSPQYSKERSSSSYDPSHPTSEYDYNRRGSSSYQSEGRGQYERGAGTSSREPPYSRGDSHNSSTPSSFNSTGPPSRGQLLQRKPASVQDESSYGSSRNVERRRERPRDDEDYHSRDERDRYSRSNADQYSSNSQSRGEPFRAKRIVEEINDDRQGHDYGRSQRVDTGKKPLPVPRSGSNRPAPRGLLRSPDNRGSHNLLASPEKRGRWERNAPSSTGLLGNPLQPNAQGLNTLAAAVGRSPQQPLSVTQAASTVLNPLLLAGQTDPAVLEVQLQAIKVLQAEALKQQPSYDSPHSSSKPRPPPPPRQSYQPSDRGDRREEESRRNAKKEADEMRAMQGRVLYMRFKSQRILEADLKQLASAFGRVSKILIIKAKIPNGFNQAFMEMESYDCAAAMVEHYKAKPPIVCGCSVLVDRSNYRDLQLRMAQPERKRGRSRSISPIRKGTTQLPSKRVRDSRFDDKPRLNVSVSDNRRLVTHTPTRSPPRDGKSENRRRSHRSLSSERSKDEKRHSVEKKRPLSVKSDEKRSSSEKKVVHENEEESKKDEKEVKSDEKMEENDSAREDEKTGDAQVEKEKVKEPVEADPLDAIANELAMHDDFAIIDEFGEDQKNHENVEKDGKATDEDLSEQNQEQKDGKEVMTDLDQADLDLEDVNVDVNHDEAEKTSREEQDQDGNTETDAVPIPEEEGGDRKEDDKMEKDVEDMEVEDGMTDGKQEEVEERMPKDEEEKSSEEKDHEVVAQVEKVDDEDTTEERDEEKSTVDFNSQESQEEADVEEEAETCGTPSASANDQTDEVARLKFIIESALQEVNNAKAQLVALNKTTKNRATVAVSKKLKLCLDGAAMRLEGADEA